MRIRYAGFLAVVVSCFFVSSVMASSSSESESQSPEFTDVFVFGDSLSDTGNFASINGPFPTPPFFGNRVTNGFTSVDILAQSLGLSVDASLYLIGPAIGTNYAVTGARTAGLTAIDLPAQIGAFAVNQGGVAPADALYIVFIGGNDVRDARDSLFLINPPQNMAEDIVDAAVNGEIEGIQALITMGARTILVVNVTDVGVIPETGLIAAQILDNQLPSRTGELTRRFNANLKHQLKSLRRNLDSHLDVELRLFDQFDEFEELLEDATEFGFSNTTEFCFSTVNFIFNPDCNFGASFNQFVFFDEIHPTARTYSIIAKALIEEVEEFEGIEDEDDEDEDEDDEDDKRHDD